MSAIRAGVLALQGASAPHLAALTRLAAPGREVRSARDLEGLTHLILPGGESTTLHHLLRLFGVFDELRARHERGELALFGTCAGAILLARDAGGRPPTLGVLDAAVRRNAYGRQVDSFTRDVTIAPPGEPARPFPGVFIRAPRFERVGDGARVLAELDGEPVALEAPGLLATSFHPELAGDDWFHARFLASAPARAAAIAI